MARHLHVKSGKILEKEKSLQAKFLLWKYRMQDKFRAWKRKTFDPCKWGLHNDIEVDSSIGNGAIHNNLTGATQRVTSRASIHICKNCLRRRGFMQGGGHTRNFYGWELEAMVMNAGLNWNK
jgi:hypothetical protein